MNNAALLYCYHKICVRLYAKLYICEINCLDHNSLPSKELLQSVHLIHAIYVRLHLIYVRLQYMYGCNICTVVTKCTSDSCNICTVAFN